MLSLMQSFRDVRDQGESAVVVLSDAGTSLRSLSPDNLRHLMRGWSQHAKSSALRKQSLVVMTASIEENLLHAAMSQWRYKARSLVLDPMVSVPRAALNGQTRLD